MNDKMIQRVRSLLERAGHAETPEEERAACLAKADELMHKYRIERAMLNFDHRDQAKEIISKKIPNEYSNEYSSILNSIYFSILRHAGAQVKMGYDQLIAVGYEEDIQFGMLLYTDVHREFVSRMFPAWDGWRSFEENVQRIKDSGRSWMDIVKMAPERYNLNANSGSRLRSAYKREYAKQGWEMPKQQTRTPEKFRDSFASSFEDRILNRLRHYQKTNDGVDVNDKVSLAVRTDQERIREAFYDLYPEMRPATDEEKALWRKQWQAEEEAEQKRRAALTPKQREAEDLKAAREAERSRRHWARQQSRRRVDLQGAAAGESAADNVNLDRSGRNIGKTNKELA